MREYCGWAVCWVARIWVCCLIYVLICVCVHGRRSGAVLRMVYVLMDARRGIMEIDLEVIVRSHILSHTFWSEKQGRDVLCRWVAACFVDIDVDVDVGLGIDIDTQI